MATASFKVSWGILHAYVLYFERSELEMRPLRCTRSWTWPMNQQKSKRKCFFHSIQRTSLIVIAFNPQEIPRGCSQMWPVYMPAHLFDLKAETIILKLMPIRCDTQVLCMSSALFGPFGVQPSDTHFDLRHQYSVAKGCWQWTTTTLVGNIHSYYGAGLDHPGSGLATGSGSRSRGCRGYLKYWWQYFWLVPTKAIV